MRDMMIEMKIFTRMGEYTCTLSPVTDRAGRLSLESPIVESRLESSAYFNDNLLDHTGL